MNSYGSILRGRGTGVKRHSVNVLSQMAMVEVWSGTMVVKSWAGFLLVSYKDKEWVLSLLLIVAVSLLGSYLLRILVISVIISVTASDPI